MPLKTSFYLYFSRLSNKFQGGQWYFSLKSNRLKFLSTFVGTCKISFDGFVLSAPAAKVVHFWLLRHCQKKKSWTKNLKNKPPPNQPNKRQNKTTRKSPQKCCALWLLPPQSVTKKLWAMKSPYLTPVDTHQVCILFTPTLKGTFMSCHQWHQITDVITSYLETGPRKGNWIPCHNSWKCK